jgi:hypothetical protein
MVSSLRTDQERDGRGLLLPHFVEKRYIIDIKEYKIVMKEFF